MIRSIVDPLNNPLPNRNGQVRRAAFRALALLFVVWLAAVAGVEGVVGNWERLGETIPLAIARLSTGQWHFATLGHHAAALGFWALFVLACYGLGAPFASFLMGSRQTRFSRWLLGWLLGSILLGLIVFFLGVLRLWGSVTAPALLGLLALQAGIHLYRERRGLARDLKAIPRAMRPADWVMAVGALVMLALLVLYALSPPVQSDALRYHLAAPDRWRQLGRIAYLPGFAHSNMPFLVEMNFALALMLGIPAGAKLVHLTYLLAAAGVMALMVRALLGRMRDNGARRGPFRPGLAAAVLLLTHPVAGPVGAWAYVDVASLAYTLAMIWALGRWLQKEGPRGLALAGAMAGGAFACKYTNLLPVGLGALVILLAGGWNREGRGARAPYVVTSAVRFGLLAVLIVSPWLARNLLHTGNPVYPLAWGIFGGPDWSAANAEFYAAKAGEKGTATALLQQQLAEPGRRVARGQWEQALNESRSARIRRFVMLPWNTYRWPGAFEGFAQGPLLLLVLPVALLAALAGFGAAGALRAWWLYGAFAAFLFISWAFTYQSNRFLLPVPALLAVFLAAWAERGALRWPARAAIVFVLAAQALWVADFLVAREGYGALRYSLLKESREDYLSRTINYYDAAQWVNENLAPGMGVFLAGEHRTFYFEVPVLGADWFDTPAPLRVVRAADSADAALDALLANHVPLVLVNAREWLVGPYAPAIAQAMQAAPDEDAQRRLLAQVLAEGARAVAPQAPMLGSGTMNYDYMRQRFTHEEWSRWVALIRSERLRVVHRDGPLIWIFAIVPQRP